MMQSQYCEDSFDTSCCTEKVPNRTLRAAYVDMGCTSLARFPEEKALNSTILCRVS
jgi:hypothetical protein